MEIRKIIVKKKKKGKKAKIRFFQQIFHS